MRRFVLTGAPGAGKTSILTVLRARGYDVVDEAATDVNARRLAAGVARPETEPGFVASIVALQRERQLAADGPGPRLFDRSPVCTLALARYLGLPEPPELTAELERIARDRTYERRVFLVRDLGFVTPTAVRRIGHADAQAFGWVHEECYLERGFVLVDVPPGPVGARADLVEDRLRDQSTIAW